MNATSTSGTRHESSQLMGKALIAYIVLSALYMYSPLDREQAAGSVDSLGMFKLLIRAMSLGIVILVAFQLRKSPGFVVVCRRLAPILLFGAWCVLSMAWSPLPAKSLAKASGVLGGGIFAVCLGTWALEEERADKIIRFLAVTCLVLTVTNLIAEFATFGKMAFYQYRFRSDVARDGVLMHVGGQSQIAGVGIFLTLGAHYLFHREWARKLLLLQLVFAPSLLFLMNSRSAIGACGIAILAVVGHAFGIRKAIATALVPSFALVLLLVLNPTSVALESTTGKAQSYFLRGQDVSEFASLSGRDEKWVMAMDGFNQAILAGGGYDVVKGYTETFINGKWQALPVHSLYLFILTGLGLVGMTLFVWGVACALLPLVLRVFQRRPRSDHALFITSTVCIFLMIGYTEILFVDGRGLIGTIAYAFLGLAGAEAWHGRAGTHAFTLPERSETSGRWGASGQARGIA